MPDIVATFYAPSFEPLFVSDDPTPLPTRPGFWYEPWPAAGWFRVGRVEYAWRRLWLREGQRTCEVTP
jgi:hypothetical protein